MTLKRPFPRGTDSQCLWVQEKILSQMAPPVGAFNPLWHPLQPHVSDLSIPRRGYTPAEILSPLRCSLSTVPQPLIGVSCPVCHRPSPSPGRRSGSKQKRQRAPFTGPNLVTNHPPPPPPTQTHSLSSAERPQMQNNFPKQ